MHVNMRILSHIYNSELSESQLKTAECSDRIWVNERVFETHMTLAQEGEAVCVTLKNGVEQVSHGVIHGVHYDDEDLIYVPSWMFSALECDDAHITLSRSTFGLCTGLMVQPYTSDHTHAENPIELLQVAFEQYTVISPGTSIPLLLTDEKQVLVDILEVRPNTNEPRCIRNCEIELELMRPLDMPLPVPPMPVPPVASSSEAETQGNVLGGTQGTSGKSSRELALEAALRRLKMSEEANTK